jgi:hypothetical protein
VFDERLTRVTLTYFFPLFIHYSVSINFFIPLISTATSPLLYDSSFSVLSSTPLLFLYLSLYSLQSHFLSRAFFFSLIFLTFTVFSFLTNLNFPLCTFFCLPNFVVDGLKLLLCIREVPDSHLGPETGYQD